MIHFAHIPKCAGTSMIDYISTFAGVEIGFFDCMFTAKPSAQSWNKTSPQHIDGISFSRLFPQSFFTEFFALVRHPLSRLRSAYKFQRYIENKISHQISLDKFIKEDLSSNYDVSGWMDNHFCPQTRFFYPGANYSVFKMEENGILSAKKYIDLLLGSSNPDIDFPCLNKASNNFLLDEGELLVSNESMKILNQIYKEDFENFLY